MKTYSIETVAIGDELLTGKIADTNSQYVSGKLFETGFAVQKATVIPDRNEVIKATLLECAERCDFVFCFGGLGPTSDDLTAQCAADLLDCTLKIYEPALEKLIQLYQLRNREVTPQARKQVFYPEKATPYFNSKGMAPGFKMALKSCTFFFFPGVPVEMKAIFEEAVLPQLTALVQNDKLSFYTFRCMGIFESDLQRLMDPIEAALPKTAWLGYRTVYPENHLTLYWKGEISNFEKFKGDIRKLLGSVCYSEKNEEIESLIVHELKSRKLKIAFAESCTGGLTAQRLTRIPGCSEVLWAGLTPYQYQAKNQILGLDLENAEEAISMECSVKLAERLLKFSGVDLVATVTGRIEKEVCDLYLVVRGQGKILPLEFKLAPRNRYELQWGASSYLLNLIREYLKDYSSS